MIRFTIVLFCISLLAGCSANNASSPHAVTPATPDQKAALLGRVQSLAGTWEMTDEKGQTHTAVVFTVTSAGSAVREIMFPGDQAEMVNMYHMDGPSLVMVHYCAEGNQPHMRAKQGAADRIEFKSDGVSNLTAPAETYMGNMTIVFLGPDHIREEWQSIKEGKVGEHAAIFDLKRKKG